MKLNQDEFEKLCGKVYFFSINVVGFVKSLKKAGIENEQTIILMKSAAELAQIFLDLDEIEENKEYNDRLNKCSIYAKNCLNILKDFRVVDKLLINEKNDLHIEADNFVKVFEAMLNQN